MTPHQPKFYVSGVYLKERDTWMGDFYATCDELLNYSENCVNTVEELSIVLTMATAQAEYEEWWEKVRKENS